jgi:hypothetical protein
MFTEAFFRHIFSQIIIKTKFFMLVFFYLSRQLKLSYRSIHDT